MKTIKTVQINHIAVWILIVFNMMLGFVWYSPSFFQNSWMNLLGKTSQQFENSGLMRYLVLFISSAITIYTLAWLYKKLEIKSFFKGVYYALIIWFGFSFCEILYIDQNELMPYDLTWINAGRSLVTFAVSGFLLGFWNRFSETKIPDVPPQAPEQPAEQNK